MKAFQTAKMDSQTKIFTLIILLFLVLFPFASLFFRPQKLPVSIFLFVLMYAIIFISYSYIPKKISVSDSQILIKNFFLLVKINLKEIKSIEKNKKNNFHFRTFGIGGLFGYFGYFNGNEVWYVTNIQKKTIITLKSGKKYIISPEDTAEFILEIQKKGEFNALF